jgi:hypothetical protein
MISVKDLEAAYRLRGAATDEERSIEEAIFSKNAAHSDEEIEQLLTSYARAKSKRAAASIQAARLFMQATPEVRASAEWRSYTPGHEDDPGRGNDVVL